MSNRGQPIMNPTIECFLKEGLTFPLMVNATMDRKMEVTGGLITGPFTRRKFGKEGYSPLFLDYNGRETCCRLIMRTDKLGTISKLECTTYHCKS